MENKPLFATEISVLVNHLNYGNHLGYDSVLSLMQEARMRWLKTLNQHASEAHIENNIGWLIRDVHVTYESEAFHGDKLHIEPYVASKKRTSFTLDYLITNLTSNKLLCRASTVQVCFDKDISKPCKIPLSLGL